MSRTRDDLPTLPLADQSEEALHRLHREGFLAKKELTLELQRRKRVSNQEAVKAHSPGSLSDRATRPNVVPVRLKNGRVSIDEDEYNLILTMLGAAKSLMPTLERAGVPVCQPEQWRILSEGFGDLAMYFRWAGDSGTETQIADLLALRAELAADG